MPASNLQFEFLIKQGRILSLVGNHSMYVYLGIRRDLNMCLALAYLRKRKCVGFPLYPCTNSVSVQFLGVLIGKGWALGRGSFFRI
jgi:hypothetical protein